MRAAIGDFRILREIGRGGMGIVYEAEQLTLGRRVALKLLPASWTRNSQARARFMHEAQTAAALNHPNIVTIHDIAEENGIDIQPYEIVNTRHSHQSAAKAVELCRNGTAEVLMKGSLHTDELMSAVVPSATGLRTERRR